MPRPKGLKQTPATKAKIGKGNTGKRRTPDQKANYSEGATRMWRRRRRNSESA